MEKQWKRWDFIFLGSKITADVECSHNIKRCLLLGRKTMTNLHSILKTRDITLPTKVHIVKTLLFSVVMYGCDSWTREKNWRFWTVVLEKTLERIPWTTRNSNQSNLKEINPEYSLEGLSWSWSSNTLATWCRELTYLKRPWCWERLGAGGEGDDRGWDSWMVSPTQWTWVWVDSGSWCWTGRPGMLQFMGLQRVGYDWATELNCIQKKVSLPPSYRYWQKEKYLRSETEVLLVLTH